MKRDIETTLVAWKKEQRRKPLLLRGARQVGKTTIIRQFGKEHFDHLVEINFELHPECIPYFEDLDPSKIVNLLTALLKVEIIPGKTLLFLDEIQDCPRAIMALRYFFEMMPELHVIAAGSLLEFALSSEDFRMPVGRIHSLYLKPMSFRGFLIALGYHNLLKQLDQATSAKPISSQAHEHLLKLVKDYMVVGGMPEVVQTFVDTKNLAQCERVQVDIQNTYRSDMAKYAKQVKHKYLKRVFDQAPHILAKHFKYTNIDREMLSRDIKEAIEMLQDAGYLYQVFATSAGGIPLEALMNVRKFKLLMLDVGLATRASGATPSLLLTKDVLTVNQGALTEQFVGQELLAYTPPNDPGQLFFWRREKASSSAEVDFIIHHQGKIYPIEVKAGAAGRLRSLYAFLNERKLPLGIRISQLPLSQEGPLLNVPLYMIHQLNQLLSARGSG